MEKYITITRIAEESYMVIVEANSLYGAEHIILDKGICGRHEYSIQGCQAFGQKEIKTNCFMGMALNSKTVSLEEITEIIETRNSRIKAKDEAEDQIYRIQLEMKRLSEELEEAKKILTA